MYRDLSTICVDEGSTIREAIARMSRNRLGIVLVVDDDWRLVGTITDGDVRRAILANVDLEQRVSVLLVGKAGSPYARPVTAPAEADRGMCLRLLQQHGILQLPLLDQQQRVIGLVTLDDFLPKQELPLQAVIMAGGLGRRLRPMTEDMPKPMLPVGGRPLMEIIIEQLRTVGIRRVNITTHYQAQKITDHFEDGHEFGVHLSYVAEDRPLGTAGALGLMDVPRETILVINGDILTQVDFRAMLVYHREHGADLTVAVRQYRLEVPYGVIESDGPVVRRLTEKPALDFFVNAGIYLLEPGVLHFVPAGERFDMTDLIQNLLASGRPVISFPVHEYWLDIGQYDDYRRAQQDTQNWKLQP